MTDHERESALRPDERPFDVPTVSPVGVVSYPSTWSVSTTHHRPRRPLVLAVAALFVLMTVATAALSLGAYCLVSDGGDGRALDIGPRGGPTSSVTPSSRPRDRSPAPGTTTSATSP